MRRVNFKGSVSRKEEGDDDGEEVDEESNRGVIGGKERGEEGEEEEEEEEGNPFTTFIPQDRFAPWTPCSSLRSKHNPPEQPHSVRKLHPPANRKRPFSRPSPRTQRPGQDRGKTPPGRAKIPPPRFPRF
jgi:hypothetical protein